MIRDFTETDADAVVAINAANEPAVGRMGADKLEFFARLSPFLKVLDLDGAVAGMLIGLTEAQTEYESPNFEWFRRRYPKFAYVDRIAVLAHAVGRGFGQNLYRAFEGWTLEHGRNLLCAEVNTVPANPRSMRFHRSFGFVEVARFNPYDPADEVAMLVKDCSAGHNRPQGSALGT